MMCLEQLRWDAWDIFGAGLKAASARRAIGRALHFEGDILTAGDIVLNLADFDRVILVGAGKASGAMAAAAEELLGSRISAGYVNVKYGHTYPSERVTQHEAGHPVLDAETLVGTERILSLVEDAGEGDLVLCCLSGGGSALLEEPAEGISLSDLQSLTEVLLRCGATIHEMNVLRKHLSKVKGGGFARRAAPARVVSLILSDVVGDNLDVIASGPAVPDPSTFSDCLEVVEKYGIGGEVADSVRERFEVGVAGKIEETPKEGDAIFESASNIIIGNNRTALEAAAERGTELGYKTEILSSTVEGEAREVAAEHAALAVGKRKGRDSNDAPVCIIAGGETTVTVRGDGKGGRNQEYALAATLEIQGIDGLVMLSGGTDGSDGPTDAAGAIVDGRTIERGEELGLGAKDALKRNDSYHYFEPLGDLIVTGPTDTNVMDVQIILIG